MANFFKPKPTSQNVGQQISITIDKLNDQGCGVGRYQKKPIFVEGTLPLEKVEVKITEKKSKYFQGKLIAIKQESSDRVDPKCKYFYRCGGCDLQHLNYVEHLNFKQNKVETLFSREGVLANRDERLPWQPAITSQAYHYRRKARIGVQYNKKGDAIVGFRQKGTNQLVSINECVVLTPLLSHIFNPLKKLIATLSLSQSIGHIEVIDTEKLTVVVRQLKALNAVDTNLWQLAAQKNAWNVLIDSGDALLPLPPLNHELSPADVGVTTADESLNELSYRLSDELNIKFNANDFIQVNHDVNAKMVEQAINWLNLSPADVVLDLFCGLGNFSLPIASRVTKVIGVEGMQSMVDKASHNALQNNLDNCDFYQANLNSAWSEQAWINTPFTKVLLDPARAGAWEAVNELVPLKIPTLLYVSCDPQTLARDAQYLTSQGYKIKKIALMDMFSQTKHIETMVLFTL